MNLDLISRARAFYFPPINVIPVTAGTNGGDQLKNIASQFITWILIIAGVLAVAYLIYGGIVYITAGTNAEAATKGRTAIVNAIIGVIIIALAFVIVNFVAGALKGSATGY